MTQDESILKHGSCWPLKELPLPDRLKDLEEALVFGNHKGAESNPVILKDPVKKDVAHGYDLVLSLLSVWGQLIIYAWVRD